MKIAILKKKDWAQKNYSNSTAGEKKIQLGGKKLAHENPALGIALEKL